MNQHRKLLVKAMQMLYGDTTNRNFRLVVYEDTYIQTK
jgi:hypothetical protein